MAKKTRFPKALLKLISTETREAMNGMGEKELDELIVESTGEIAENRRLLKEDDDVDEARKALAEVSAPYTDAIKGHNAKILYALYVKGQIDADPDEG